MAPSRYCHIDHRLAKTDGGAGDIGNRMLLCGPCNGSKAGTKTLTSLFQDNRKEGHCQPGWPRQEYQEMLRHIDAAIDRLKDELK